MEPERANKAIRLPTSRSLRDNKAKCGYQYRHLANTLIEASCRGVMVVLGIRNLVMIGSVLFTHLQSVIVSHWCMQHNAKLRGHLNGLQQILSNPLVTPTPTAQLIGLYRRRDEPLGQTFAARGARSWPAESSTGWTSATRCRHSTVHATGRLHLHPQVPTVETKET